MSNHFDTNWEEFPGVLFPVKRDLLLRPHLHQNGQTSLVAIPVCECMARRGPVGGVCGACGGAIPSREESPRSH